MRFLSTLTLVILASSPAMAAAPTTLTYVSTLTQGDAPADGIFSVTLTLFDAATAGNAKFTQEEPSLVVPNGEFIVELGSDPANPLADDVLAGGPLFLEVDVDGNELSPRVPLTSAAFARRAVHSDDADRVNGKSSQDIAGAFTAGTGLVRSADTFSIAPNSVTATLFAPGSVTSAAVAAGAVTTDALADGSVGTTQLAAGAVTSSALAANSVSATKIQGGSVTASNVTSHALSGTQLVAGTITAAEVGSDAVTASKIKAGTLTAADFGLLKQLFTVSSAAAANCPSQGAAGTVTFTAACPGCGSPPSGCNAVQFQSGCGNPPLNVGPGFSCPNNLLGSFLQ